jgi:hypothetical protein
MIGVAVLHGAQPIPIQSMSDLTVSTKIGRSCQYFARASASACRRHNFHRFGSKVPSRYARQDAESYQTSPSFIPSVLDLTVVVRLIYSSGKAPENRRGEVQTAAARVTASIAMA